MTQFVPPSSPNRGAPEVALSAGVAASAGTAVTVPVTIRHRGSLPAMMRITVLGLDSRWAPEAIALGPLQPGDTASVALTLVPERGAMGARYPFAVAVEASPVFGDDPPLMGIAESVLVVDSQERIALTIQPPTPVAVFSKRFDLQITNPGTVDREFGLVPAAARGASVSLSRDAVVVPAQRTVTVRGRVRVRHPTLMGGNSAFTFGVTARGVGAPEFAEATVRTRPVFGRGLRIAIGLAAVLAVWITAAVVFIPRISDRFTPKVAVPPPATVTSVGPSAVTSPPGGASGTGGAGTAGTATAGAGATGQSGTGGGGAAGGGGASGGGGGGGAAGAPSGAPAGYQVSGTVSGPAPQDTTVSLTQVTLLDAADAGATPAPGTNEATGNALRSAQTGPVGKVAEGAFDLPAESAPRGQSSTGSMETGADGAFQFSGVQAPGYYLLSLAKAGFQTQSFLIDSTDLASPVPLKVAMVPADGVMSGSVTGPDGQPIGAAAVTITDGTVSLETSSVSAGNAGTPGSWRVTGISTPGSYLVTAAAPGFGTASKVVTLAAGGHGTVDLRLQSGVALITGTVSGANDQGRTVGLGGITVSATDGTTTVSATTTTAPSSGSQALAGLYTLPNLPVLDGTANTTYTLTISGDGYQTQTSQVTLTPDVGSVTVNASLVRSQGVVTGAVTGEDAAGKTVGLDGVGLTLTNAAGTFKTMSTSVGQHPGSYTITGVPPGVYVLTASQSGRAPDSRNVEVKAAETVTVNLHLSAATTTAFATQSFINGAVIDARSQGPLTCDRTVTPLAAGKCAYTAATLVPVIDPSTGKATGTNKVSTTVPATSRTPYLLPQTDDATKGLPPGLYTISVTAPGYEPGSATVEVGENQRVTAPQVALQPLAIISGTVSYRVGTPAADAPTCVLVVPSGTTAPQFSDLGDDPGKCRTARSDGFTATVGSDGTYQVRGLSHGSYQLIVLPTDPEYLASPVTSILISAGTDGHFDTAIDRLGRLQITALTPDLATGDLSPVPSGADVTTVARDAARTPLTPALTTPDSGVVTVTGLQTGSGGSYQVTVSNKATTGSATVTNVGLNQTVPITVVTVSTGIFAVVGRMTTIFDGGQVPAVGVEVFITGTVGYTGQSPVIKTAHATTDANGCFAILPAGWMAKQPLATDDCPAVTDPAAMGSMPGGSSLVIRPITIAADANASVKALTATASLISASGQVRSIPSTALDAQPTPFGTHALSTRQPDGGFQGPLNNAIITVTKFPSNAGALTVTANPDGSLRWQDASLPANLVVAGNYTLSISLQGYVSTTATMSCPLGGTCTITDEAGDADIVLQQLPSITGTITFPVPLPPDVNVSLTTAALVSGPSGIGSVQVTLVQAAEPQRLSVQFRDASQPATGLARPSSGSPLVPYQFTFSLPGYSGSAEVFCGTNWADPTFGTGGCTPIAVTMKALPSFSLTVASNPPGTDLSSASVQVTTVPAGAPSATITWHADIDAWVWQQTGLPQNFVTPGSYTIVATATGFDQDPSTNTFTCTATAHPDVQDTCPFTATMFQRTNLTLSFVDGTTGAAVNDVQVTFDGTGLTTSTVNTAGNSVTFPGLITLPGSLYTAHAQAAGHRFDDFDAGSVGAVTCSGAPGGGLTAQPGPATNCTVRLSPIGTVTGRTVSRIIVNGSNVDTALPGITVTLTCATPGSQNPTCTTTPAPQAFSGTSVGADAGFGVTGTNIDQGLGSGTYDLHAEQPGYSPVNGTLTIGPGFQVSQVNGAGIELANAGTPNARVTIAMLAKPITYRAQFFAVTGGAVLPTGTYSLSGANGSYTCTVNGSTLPDCAHSTGGPIDSTGPYVEFTDVNPGMYTLTATPIGNPSFNAASSTVNGITVQVPTSDELLTQSGQLTITLLTSVQTVNLFASGGSSAPFTGSATISLVSTVTGAPALDNNGIPMTVTVTTGTTTFNDIPNGSYFLQITSPGSQPQSFPLSMAAYINPHPTDVPVIMIRSSRAVSLTLTSTAAGADMSGATFRLVQTAHQGEGPADPPQTPDSSSGNVYTFNSLPTGTWHVELTGQNGGGGGDAVAVSSGDFTVPDPPLVGGQVDPTPLPVPVLIRQGQAKLTITWPVNNCTTSGQSTSNPDSAGPPISGSAPITVTNSDGDTATVTASVSPAGTATASLFLPAGTYTWEPTGPLPNGWTWPAGRQFTITVPANATAGSVPPATPSVPLDPPVSPLTVTINVDGSPANQTIAVTATHSGQTTVTRNTSGGSVELCLAPLAAAWTVAVRDADATPDPVLLPNKTSVVGDDPSGITFDGFTLRLGAQTETVPDRPADSRQVTLALTGPGGVDYTNPAIAVSSDGSVATGKTVIVAAGSGYSLTATPPDDDPFGTGTQSASVPTTQTATQDVTATLPYVAAILTVTTTGGTTTAQNTATVTLTRGGTAVTGPTHHAADTNAYTFFDLETSTSYVASATATDGGATYIGSVTTTTSATPGATTTASLVLRQGPVIRVELPNVAGSPPAGAIVSLFSAAGTLLTTATADANGDAFFTGPTVAASTAYKIGATWTDSGTDYASAVQDVTSGSVTSTTVVTTVVLTVVTGLAITTDAPVGTAGARVGVPAAVTVSQNGVQVATGTAGAAGTITISGLARSTTYDVTATWTDTTPNPDVTYTGAGSQATSNSATPATIVIHMDASGA